VILSAVLACGLAIAIDCQLREPVANLSVPAERFRQLDGPATVASVVRKAARLAAFYQRTGNAGAAQFYRQMAARLAGRSRRAND
jgi:hypothetical protein